MSAENANAGIPKWQKNAVRIVEDDSGSIPLPKKEERKHVKPRKSFFDRDLFVKRYGILLIAAAAFTVYTVLLSSWSAHVTEKRVRQELAVEYSARLTQEIEAYEQRRMAETILTGQESFDAAVEDLAQSFDQLLANYSMEYGVTPDGCRTIGWVFIARLAQGSAEFGMTPQEILSKKNAWEGNPVSHAVREQDTQMAREIARAYMEGRYPYRYTTDYVFFVREADGSIEARTDLFEGRGTRYWSYETE